jgi:hypothetical protein
MTDEIREARDKLAELADQHDRRLTALLPRLIADADELDAIFLMQQQEGELRGSSVLTPVDGTAPNSSIAHPLDRHAPTVAADLRRLVRLARI